MQHTSPPPPATTFFTDFNASKISHTQPPSHQSVYRPPRYSSFLTRLKTNAKNRILKYHLKQKKDSCGFTTEDIYNTTGLRVQSLIKIQKEMSSLRLNITMGGEGGREVKGKQKEGRMKGMSKTVWTPRKMYGSVDKLRKEGDRRVGGKILNTLCGKFEREEESIRVENKKEKAVVYSSMAKRLETKEITYDQFYGNPRDFIVQRATAAQQKYYCDFLWKIAYTNHHSLSHNPKPRVYIGKGNNSKLIKNLFKNRWWWTLQKDQSKADFVWTQLKISSIYPTQKQTPVHDYFITEQSQEKLNIVIREDPALQVMNSGQYRKYSQYLKMNLKTERKSGADFKSRKILTSKFSDLGIARVTNHIEFSRMIGNKKALFYTMRQYYTLLHKEYTQYLPLTFHIVSGFQDTQYSSFSRLYAERKRLSSPNIWIVKPGELSNRGNGITVCNSMDQIKSIIKSNKKHPNGKTKTYIIQLYMSDPFLYKNRKFDIRHYMLVTSVNGRIKGYWYEEGYIRTTSSEFNLLNLNGLIHLTNDAVQKYGKDYGKYEKGNKLSYDEFQSYLDGKYGQNHYSFSSILLQMKHIATDVLKASSPNIDPKRRQHNFEIFGMDFMIDSTWKPFLIEINTNPCLELSSPLLSKLIPSMVENALRIGLDPLFPPPPVTGNKKLGYQENKFEMIFDEEVEGEGVRRLYEGEKRVGEMLEDIRSDDEAYEDVDEDDF